MTVLVLTLCTLCVVAWAAERKSILEKIRENIANMHRPGEMAAIGREALKDIQNTFNQVAFGHPGPMGEPGAPLSPTQFLVNQEFQGTPVKPGANAPEKDQQSMLDRLRGNATEPTRDDPKKKDQDRGGPEL